MRIGLFSDTYPPDVNGVANSTAILCNELKKHGHDVFVVATGMNEDTGWDENHEVLRLAGVEMKQLYGYVVATPFHLMALNEIRNLQLDLIHVQTEFGIGIFAHICARQLNIPLVSTYHTTYEDYTHYVNFFHSENFDALAKKAVKHLSKIYGDASTEVIVPSEKTKELLHSYHVERDIHVVPTGLNLENFSPEKYDENLTKSIRDSFGISMDDYVVIYVGRIAEEKSLDLVIEGFHLAKEHGCQLHFLIVGGGPDEEKLQDLVKQYEMEDQIHFVGKIPSENIANYYRSANAFVSASQSETQGMTFIEAMASGLPLFARYDEVLEDILVPEKTGWYFEDANDLAQKLCHFEKISKEELITYCSHCLEQVKPYQSEVFYEKILQVYEKALSAYSSMYTIEDIKVKDDCVQLALKSSNDEEISLMMSLDDYYYEGIHRGSQLASKRVEELQKNENLIRAYQRCIRKISIKDRTEKEIRDWAKQHTECEDSQIDLLVDMLIEKGFLNDVRYTEDAIARMHIGLQGDKSILRDLKRRGIPEELILEKLEEPKDLELERAKRYGEKVHESMKDDSVKMLKQKLRTKLLQKGYPSSVADEAIASLDFSENENREMDALRHCAQKARKRYERKYDDPMKVRNAIYRYCATQGYTSEDIHAILDEMELVV